MVASLILIIQNIVLSSIAATGFAMSFNVPKKYLKYCAFLSALGVGTRTILTECGASTEWGSLLGAFLMGSVALVIGSQHRIYPKIISIAAATPMFPGVYAYKATIALIKIGHIGYTPELMSEMVTYALRVSFIGGALALGLTLPGVWMFRRKMRL